MHGLIDYAGLFPPASLDLAAAVRNFTWYRLGDDNWMLGRFIVPASRLQDVAAGRGLQPAAGVRVP